MIYAAITGWGKCLPPAILSNDDLATFLDTTDEWITSRTGMKERRISHVDVSELAYVAAARALAAAGKKATDIDLIVFGSTTFDELCPNAASNVQRLLGASNAACMDVNTACTSGMYSLSVATAMIKSGVVNSAIVIGAEVVSKVMEWSNRDVAVLFGDGAAALYLEKSETEQGVLAESLGCYGESREILSVQGWGMKYADKKRILGDTSWAFAGQEIFKKAIAGMSQACEKTLAKSGLQTEDIDLVVPHQANLRIIDTLAKKMRLPKNKVFINIERYGNMSAATALIALVEAVQEGHVAANSSILMPAFGGGLTWSAHLIKWGERTQVISESEIALPDTTQTGLELVDELRRKP
ncbi:beta-ketoacyl-ACP synthase 3 [Desulfopila aestuarii]|uniref:Beta-ketoacyl-[acyl-carrier-protein] synthase III n=1 Tax=Desulfopila aestuarii DSM 18488 TaxID=1121416 RepID=A0A1M7YE55_9BACT|nr:beta-ketoacyl-ACP synthase 3 [Desulfopila aestuarii]SHO50930.1 3-oxoacyl-[acyl-carrier-protein] synthase-3 [Desulfopila aestuarii DSM 18488]